MIMPSDRQRDMDTAKQSNPVLLPLIARKLGANRVISCEEWSESPVCAALDQIAGVDAIAIEEDGIRGIAIRVQTPENAKYASFTVRVERVTGGETELAKRVKAIEEGHLYPHYTVHAFYDYTHNKVLSGAICDTCDLYGYLTGQGDKVKRRKAYDGNEFFHATFDEVESSCPSILHRIP